MKKHPNRMPFRGVLTILDAPSDRPPAGARGHRVVLTRAAAEPALPSLIGMAVDFNAGFDGHDARRKVGIITSAAIVSASDSAAAKNIPSRSSPARAMVREPYPGSFTLRRIPPAADAAERRSLRTCA